MRPEPKAATFALALATLAAPAHCDASKLFKPGDFIVAIRDYDFETDSFTDAPPKGEEHACFQVDRVARDEIDITLVAGPYHPWWSDMPLAPGFSDTFVRADGYAKFHPDAPPMELVGLMYKIVPACPPVS